MTIVVNDREVVARRVYGLGDIIERAAQPIAIGIDSVLGTNIRNCAGCQKRKQRLNGKTIGSKIEPIYTNRKFNGP